MSRARLAAGWAGLVVLLLIALIDPTAPATTSPDTVLPPVTAPETAPSLAPIESRATATAPAVRAPTQIVVISTTSTTSTTSSTTTTTTTTVPEGPPDYVRGDCESLADLFRWWGASEDEVDFFLGDGPYGRNVLFGESGCGLDTYAEPFGDTGVCMLTALHAQPGYFFGSYWPTGWADELFGLRLGKANAGIDRDHPFIVPACLWLLRAGEPTPGVRHVSAWDATR